MTMFKKENIPPVAKKSLVSRGGQTFSRRAEILTSLAAWIWAVSIDEDRGFRNFIRGLLRVNIIVFQEFIRDNIPLRASALTFIVILSMVPILALGTAVLKGLGKGDELRQAAQAFIVHIESSANSRMAKSIDPDIGLDELDGKTLAQRPKPEDSLSEHLNRAVTVVFDYADKTNFAALGAVGTLFLLLAVFMVLLSIEQTVNDIWQTSSGRSPTRKIRDYLVLITIMPLAINFGVAISAALHNKKLLAIFQTWLPGIGLQLLSLLPFFALIATFTFLYGFLPNTKVRFTAALTGGVVGGTIWLLIQALYFKLQIGVVNYNAIYGSFATLPLFLVWIYVSWMVFLAGAEVSFAVQIWRRYLRKKLSLKPIERLGLAFEIIAAVAANYHLKKITTRDNLVLALKQPDAFIKELLDTLSGAGFLRYVEKDDGSGFVPAAPLSELKTLEIGELILGELPNPIIKGNPAIKAFAAVRKSLADQKIPSGNYTFD
jgi:membrane protein